MYNDEFEFHKHYITMLDELFILKTNIDQIQMMMYSKCLSIMKKKHCLSMLKNMS